MRLTTLQQTTICVTVVSIVGVSARVWLFGSRCRDEAKGGDVDLLVESEIQPSIMQRAQVKMMLESSLLLPVDIVGIQRGATPSAFQRIALATGIQLC